MDMNIRLMGRGACSPSTTGGVAPFDLPICITSSVMSAYGTVAKIDTLVDKIDFHSANVKVSKIYNQLCAEILGAGANN